MFVPETVALSVSVIVLELVPPAMLNPTAAGAMVKPLTVLFVKFSVPSTVAKTPVVGKVNVVLAVVFNVTSEAFEPVVPVVVNALPVLILPPSVIVFPELATPVPPFAPATIPVTFVDVPIKFAVIVPALKLPVPSLFTIVFAELLLVAPFANCSAEWISTAAEPPTLATEGEVAVPDKSPANWILPFTVLAASGVALVTKAVVASWFVFVPAVAVGAVGTPVNETSTIVLLVKVSVPANVAIVPVVGNVTFVTPVLVNVVL